jgi:hypothetical protein
MILEEGMKVETIGIPPDDAQFLETRKFQVNEIARLFRVPPHLIGDLDRATFSNVEQQSLDFVIHTLRPWLVRWEQAIARDLILPRERERIFAEHLVNGLLRGDLQSRYEAYATGRQNGWLSANDIRQLENMNPIADGDVYLVPLNMVPADQAGDAQQQPAGGSVSAAARARVDTEQRAAEIGAGRVRLANNYLPMFEDVSERVLRRELADVRRSIEKYLVKNGDLRGFQIWLREFYAEHGAFWRRMILPVLRSYAAQIAESVAGELGGQPGHNIDEFIEQYASGLGTREATSSQYQLEALLEEAAATETPTADIVGQRLDEWEATRAGKIAHSESRRSLGAFTKTLYIASGVLALRWITNGDSCPYCTALEGRTVGIQGWFLEQGQTFQPDGAERPLSVNTHAVGHPPLHAGCNCTIIAG